MGVVGDSGKREKEMTNRRRGAGGGRVGGQRGPLRRAEEVAGQVG